MDAGFEGFSTGNKRQRHQVCVLLAPFCAMRNINSTPCLLEDEKSLETRRFEPRKAATELTLVAARNRTDFRR